MKKLIPLFLIFILACSPQINLDQEKEELLQTDINFSNRSIEVGNHKAFLEYASPNVVLLKPNSYPIIGKPAMKELYAQLSDSGYRLTWKPSYGKVSESADLGYTFGIFLLEIIEARLPDGQGEQKGQTIQGTYCTIWEKNDKGEWRFVLDTGNQGLSNDQ